MTGPSAVSDLRWCITVLSISVSIGECVHRCIVRFVPIWAAAYTVQADDNINVQACACIDAYLSI